MRAALAEPTLRRALAVFLVFGILEEAVWLGLLLYAHDIGGTVAVGAIAVAQLVPATALAPVTATWLDRLPVRAGLVLAYGSTALATLVVGVLLVVDAPVGLVVAAAVVQSSAVSMGRPAHFAALPRLADLPSRLVAANAASGTVDSLGVLLGPLAVAVALTTWGAAPLVVVLALLMGAGALALSRAPIHAPPAHTHGSHAHLTGSGASPDGSGASHPDGSSASPDGSGASLDGSGASDADAPPEPFLQAATRGVREVRRIPGAFTLLLVVGLMWVVQGALDVLGVSFAIDVLEAGDEGASLIAAGNGTGLLLGSIAAVVLVGVARLTRVVVIGAVVSGSALAVVGATQTLLLAVVLVALSAMARLFVDVAGRTLLHRNADGRVLARVFGVQEAVMSGGLAIGAAFAPIAVALVGERLAFVATGVLLAVPAMLALPSLRALDHSGVLAAERIELLRGQDLFAPLAPPQLERLALSSMRMGTVAGDVLIEQGDEGDRFYAVHSGQYRVDKDGETVAVLGPGTYFGEIALLRNVPRTASVICIEDGDLLVLEREPFLVAMSQARPPARD